MKITVYKKAGCPWAAAVIAFLNELGVGCEIKNVTSHPIYATEVVEKSGKCISPTVEMDGEILADASVEDVAGLLEKRGIVI
jgi:glutaredoxin